jgi:hypothetical protein
MVEQFHKDPLGISHRCHACGLATFTRHGLVSIIKRVIPATGTENVKENVKGVINKSTSKKVHLPCRGGKHATLSARCTCAEMKDGHVVHATVTYEHFAALPQLVHPQRCGFRPVNGLQNFLTTG